MQKSPRTIRMLGNLIPFLIEILTKCLFIEKWIHSIHKISSDIPSCFDENAIWYCYNCHFHCQFFFSSNFIFTTSCNCLTHSPFTGAQIKRLNSIFYVCCGRKKNSSFEFFQLYKPKMNWHDFHLVIDACCGVLYTIWTCSKYDDSSIFMAKHVTNKIIHCRIY